MASGAHASPSRDAGIPHMARSCKPEKPSPAVRTVNSTLVCDKPARGAVRSKSFRGSAREDAVRAFAGNAMRLQARAKFPDLVR
jgi:hypothetical protein